MSVSLVIAYLFSKSPLLRPLANYSVRLPHKILIYIIFSSFCILGTYVGLDIDDAIANTGRSAPCWGGLLGGPAGGISGGIDRWSAPLHAGGDLPISPAPSPPPAKACSAEWCTGG
ncbi:LytS/YhcK type 5TM receptor domain-containing protein [Aeromonas veronii]|uniref:LytS/YhcK type 5TM receptor domain-containing protein n=1 Tax=Aeromonas veronii TaxID=654 RepID=UPI003C7033E9